LFNLLPAKPDSRVITVIALLASAWSVRRIVVPGKQKAKLRGLAGGAAPVPRYLKKDINPLVSRYGCRQYADR
jgi:hypothetical protein